MLAALAAMQHQQLVSGSDESVLSGTVTRMLAVLRPADDRVYTDLPTPVAWRAPETFEAQAASRQQVASAATDVFMLGGSFLELLCGCERTPYDWLGAGNILPFRASYTTKHLGPVEVMYIYLPDRFPA